jgi:hypothetical protein
MIYNTEDTNVIRVDEFLSRSAESDTLKWKGD